MEFILVISLLGIGLPIFYLQIGIVLTGCFFVGLIEFNPKPDWSKSAPMLYKIYMSVIIILFWMPMIAYRTWKVIRQEIEILRLRK